MARQLGLHRQTLKKYLDLEALPRKSQGSGNIIEQYFPYIKQRMEEEPGIYLTTLWNELKEQGYPGAYTTLSDAFKYYGIRIGKKARQTKAPSGAGLLFKPSTTAILFVSDQNKLNKSQLEIISKICKVSEVLRNTLALVKGFRTIMKDKTGNRELKQWIELSKQSGINEMASFAKGLLSDYDAIENALTLKWSNGPVEGNVNRLKTIKRQMYGRAGFELLKKRLILTPS